MKFILLMIAAICSVKSLKSQETNAIIVNGNYYFNYASVEAVNAIDGSSYKNKNFRIDAIRSEIEGSKYKLTVSRIEGDLVYFTFSKFSTAAINKLINNSESDKKVEYSIPKDVFLRNIKPLYNRIDWRVGAFTVPFKLRFDDFNFDANVNIGTNVGARIRFNREIEDGFALEPIFGVGLASIKLDDANSIVAAATNVSAFSVNTGVLIHISNGINIGITYGLDQLITYDQKKYGWKHNGNAWLGVGINVNFSSSAKNTGNASSN
ncbi:hypothetical protein U0035_14255 [Niabella yanshanensis]|uniref:Outer membrane protein beta-barrel domain-containing protein n=1 Tax=Niabella yanshanensis TaxID=577386 RepID=A0ABZ0W0X5_9BACT|nr:hypothetical protein [Niabella yanshanensis]WQD36831.1 hypothetical protein U0035_14255 [Niabella yanshanensis]